MHTKLGVLSEAVNIIYFDSSTNYQYYRKQSTLH
jgi:hypothetical protein